MATLAILLMSLAPAVSQALHAPGSSRWVEVCTANGAKLVSPDGTDSDDTGPTAAHTLEHCPYCSLSAHAFAIPPGSSAAVAWVRQRFEVPRLFLSAPRTPYAWVTSQPRAPPALS
jgi:hypothetical protein